MIFIYGYFVNRICLNAAEELSISVNTLEYLYVKQRALFDLENVN